MDRFVDRADVVDVAAAFDESDVEYVIIGGAAGMLHGSEHGTKDIDLLVKMGLQNMVRVANALEALGVGTIEDPGTLGWATTRWTTRGGSGLDVLPRATGPGGTHIRYDDVARNAELVQAAGGVFVPVVNLDDLIMMKEAANRPKDHESLTQLRDLRKVRESSQPQATPDPLAVDRSPDLGRSAADDFGYEI